MGKEDCSSDEVLLGEADAVAPVVAAVRRSRRRAHLGGRSLDGTTHSMLARRQLEQGDSLSHRTLRERHTTQLRGFALPADADVDVAGVVAAGRGPLSIICLSKTTGNDK